MATLIFEVEFRLVSDEVIGALLKKTTEENGVKEVKQISGICFGDIKAVTKNNEPLALHRLYLQEAVEITSSLSKFPITQILLIRKNNIPTEIEEF